VRPGSRRSGPPSSPRGPAMADVVLSVLAHPDDAEFLCAGTLIRLAREHGWQVHIASMTAGDCGSAELPPERIAAVRREEGARAAPVERAFVRPNAAPGTIFKAVSEVARNIGRRFTARIRETQSYCRKHRFCKRRAARNT